MEIAYVSGLFGDLRDAARPVRMVGARHEHVRAYFFRGVVDAVVVGRDHHAEEYSGGERAAIDVLTSIASRRGVKPCALLGDMLELGEYSRLMHDQLGQYAAQMKVQKLYCYGAMADVVAEAAIKKGVRADNVYVSLDSDNPTEMAKMINSSMQSGDVLLVKASRAVSAERVIEALTKIRKK